VSDSRAVLTAREIFDLLSFLFIYVSASSLLQ